MSKSKWDEPEEDPRKGKGKEPEKHHREEQEEKDKDVRSKEWDQAKEAEPKAPTKVSLWIIAAAPCALGCGTRKVGDVIGKVQLDDNTAEALANYKLQEGDEAEVRNAMLPANRRFVTFDGTLEKEALEKETKQPTSK